MSLQTFLKFVELRFKERMEYRGAFLLGVVAQIIGYGGSYLVIWLMMQRFHSIDGWSWPEIALLYSIGLFSYSLGASFTFIQMTELESMVREGTFDGVLVKPVNPFLYIVARKYNVGYLAHYIISGCILIWSLLQLSIEWTVFKMVYFILVLISGAMIQAAILSIIGAWSFIVVRTGFLFSLYFSLEGFHFLSTFGLWNYGANCARFCTACLCKLLSKRISSFKNDAATFGLGGVDCSSCWTDLPLDCLSRMDVWC